MTRQLVLLAAALAAIAVPAEASESFPALIAEQVGAPLPADGSECLLCHTANSGGEDTATRPFVRSLRELGLRATTRSLRQALERAASADSDGDGAPDLTEIARGRDPNRAEIEVTDGGLVVGTRGGEVPAFQTGCSLHGVQRGWGSVGVGLVVLGLLRRESGRVTSKKKRGFP